MKNTITSIWGHASACLFISPLALLFSAGTLGAAVGEAFSNYADHCANVDSGCHAPRDWVIIPLGIIGLSLLAIAATTLLRGLYLAGRHIHRRLGAA